MVTRTTIVGLTIQGPLYFTVGADYADLAVLDKDEQLVLSLRDDPEAAFDLIFTAQGNDYTDDCYLWPGLLPDGVRDMIASVKQIDLSIRRCHQALFFENVTAWDGMPIAETIFREHEDYGREAAYINDVKTSSYFHSWLDHLRTISSPDVAQENINEDRRRNKC